MCVMGREASGIRSPIPPHTMLATHRRTGERWGTRGRRVDLNAFINRWTDARGGAERANYQMFLSELCEALDLRAPTSFVKSPAPRAFATRFRPERSETRCA